MLLHILIPLEPPIFVGWLLKKDSLVFVCVRTLLFLVPSNTIKKGRSNFSPKCWLIITQFSMLPISFNALLLTTMRTAITIIKLQFNLWFYKTLALQLRKIFFSHHYKLAFHKESYRLYLETVDLVGKVFLTLSYSELWRLHWQSTCSSYSLSLSPKREISPPDLLIKLDFFTELTTSRIAEWFATTTTNHSSSLAYTY